MRKDMIRSLCCPVRAKQHKKHFEKNVSVEIIKPEGKNITLEELRNLLEEKKKELGDK